MKEMNSSPIPPTTPALGGEDSVVPNTGAFDDVVVLAKMYASEFGSPFDYSDEHSDEEDGEGSPKTPESRVFDAFARSKKCAPAIPPQEENHSRFPSKNCSPLIPRRLSFSDCGSDDDEPHTPRECVFDPFAPGKVCPPIAKKRTRFDDEDDDGSSYHTPGDCVFDPFAPGKVSPPAPKAKRTRLRLEF